VPVGDTWSQQFGTDATLLQDAQAVFSADKMTRIAVAVSGGSDSMACLHLMARTAKHEGWQVMALTVDHALRPESDDEACGVGRVCAGLGVSHHVLRWQHGAVAGNLMDAARKARYALMADWAATHEISHIVLGHTADDQAETFLMGLARGAGLDGLVGMRKGWDQGGVRFVRPFLTQSRADLRGYLTRNGMEWVDDPSNENDRFTRVKARRVLKALKPLGITADRLNGVILNLTKAQGIVQAATRDAAAQICRTDAGEVIFDRKLWLDAGGEVQHRLLCAALRWVSGAAYAPRGSGVDRVSQAIIAGGDATLAGCRIRVTQAVFRVVREPKAVSQLSCPVAEVWDRRWALEGPIAEGLHIRALGAEGLQQCKRWRQTGHSRDSLVVSPSVWYGETLISAPLAGFGPEWTARIVAGFSLFVVSH
jgi:tRNA(Ile)-lysidine synthase